MSEKLTLTDPDAMDRAARAVCAHSLGGFCFSVGGDLGCKNGRGLSPHWSNCVANPDQLELSGHASAARAVLDAALQENGA